MGVAVGMMGMVCVVGVVGVVGMGVGPGPGKSNIKFTLISVTICSLVP